MKIESKMTKIYLPIDFSDYSIPESFANHPNIELTETNEFFIQDRIYELTGDENSIRDWIRTQYNDSLLESEIDELIKNSLTIETCVDYSYNS